ncbi:hypothetical protein BDW22DRAFT_1354722 [Trametopsis cervina]|nr:hypothetical protein BDW22DRAFT_1354722 [Trametopsis cervina]
MRQLTNVNTAHSSRIQIAPTSAPPTRQTLVAVCFRPFPELKQRWTPQLLQHRSIMSIPDLSTYVLRVSAPLLLSFSVQR